MTYRIRDDKRDLEFIFEGQEDEVLRLYRKIAGLETNLTKATLESAGKEPKPRIAMPTDQEVEAFVKAQANYEHDLHMVQKEFFGKTFASRGTSAPMYHRTNRQLTMVRQKIEKEEGRKFKAETIDRNFKRYEIEPEQELVFGDEKEESKHS